MRNIIKKILYIFLFVLAITLTKNIYAGTAYPMSIDMKAKVQSNGSMNVVESIVYNMQGQLNGTYRDILLTGEYGASKIVVNSVRVDGKYYLYNSYTLSNGADGEYNINNISGGKQIKVFMPSSDETRIVELDYTLYDVVTVYNDIAELYWNFIGDGWDNGIDSVDITIELPGDAGSNLKIFGHGPLNGNSQILDSKTAGFTVSNLASNTPVDARVLFPTSLVTTSKKVNEAKLDQILSEEQGLANEANAARTKAKAAIYIIYAVSVVVFILPLITYSKFRKNRYKASFTGDYYRELPEDYGPAIMNKCIGGKFYAASSKDMLATLLDLVRRKYVTIEEYEIKKFLGNKKDYKLNLVNQDLSQLNEQEKYFVEKMIFTFGKTETTLEQIKKDNSSSTTSQRMAYADYNNWKEKIGEVAITKGVASNVKLTRQEKKWVWLSIVVGIICLLTMKIHGSPVIMGLGIVLVLEYIIIITSMSSSKYLTEKGIEHKAMWLAFKKFLLDFSNMKDYDEKSIVLWEHYLVYATGLGIAEKVIKNLKIKFPTEFNENDVNMNTVVLAMCLNTDTYNSFNSSFNSFASTAFSNPSSGSGSGGGFSGGGGGGRRRRWRRRLLK